MNEHDKSLYNNRGCNVDRVFIKENSMKKYNYENVINEGLKEFYKIAPEAEPSYIDNLKIPF